MALFATAAEGAADLAQRCERPRQTSTGWQACCPAHQDRTPSLSITPTADRVLVHCHAGCTPEAIVAALGRTLADLFIDDPPRGRPPAAAPAPPAPPPAGPPRVTATYDYDDAQGALLYQVRRWEPGRHGQQKSFTQHRPNPAHPGAWLDNMQGVTRQLSHLPEVLRAVAAGEPIYLPEGEKDANNVIDLGVTATTNAGGAGKWAPQYTATLRGAHVVLLQDNDASGRRHTAVVTQALYGVAASLKLVELPGLPPKGDVSDWLAAGGTRAQLEALVAQTPLWTPALAVGDGQRRRVGSQGEADPSPRPDEPPLPYSDYTNALALVRDHGQDLRYAQSTPSASLLAKDRHDGIPNDIARLRGARLVTAVEIGEGKRLNEELMKRLTGQDTLTARFLHAEFFDFKAEFKLCIACNHLPQIRGQDHAIWRRIKLIPFTVTIPDEEQDKDLPAKLSTELPGILRWTVQGCLDWQREGLGTPEEVKVATADYRASMDVVGRFLAEECVEQPYAKVKASALYKAYQEWCATNGEHCDPRRSFGMRLSEQGYRRYTNNGSWWEGIGLPATATERTERTE